MGVDVEVVDALDGDGVVPGTLDGFPPPRDGRAAVPRVKSLDDEWWLRSAAGDESSLAGEGDGSFGVAGDVIDAVAGVGEVRREEGLSYVSEGYFELWR